MGESKTCVKCGETKLIDGFSRRKDSADGYRRECRECNLRLQEASRVANGKLTVGMDVEFTCVDCEATFSHRIVRGGRRRTVCDDCARKRGIAASIRWHRETGMGFTRHGITEAQYDARLAEQGGGCAVCGSTVPGGKGRFHIDHDHACCPGRRSCGKCVRGLLCHSCNIGVGYLKDDPAMLRKAADYIERHR